MNYHRPSYLLLDFQLVFGWLSGTIHPVRVTLTFPQLHFSSSNSKMVQWLAEYSLHWIYFHVIITGFHCKFTCFELIQGFSRPIEEEKWS